MSEQEINLIKMKLKEYSSDDLMIEIFGLMEEIHSMEFLIESVNLLRDIERVNHINEEMEFLSSCLVIALMEFKSRK
jgi:hypothetical protein